MSNYCSADGCSPAGASAEAGSAVGGCLFPKIQKRPYFPPTVKEK